MPDISNSTPTNLPTTRQLLRSTLIAAAIAALLLVAVVLPAEYGVDPIGIGNVLGLTEMGRIKTSLAKESALAENASQNVPDAAATVAAGAGEPAPTPAAAEATTTVASANRNDVTTVLLQPGQGREIKLAMREGARVNFDWSTDKGVVNFDEHADSKVPRRDYHGYRKGSAVAKDEGVLTAAFEGSHGWFWRNRGNAPLTVTLRTNGNYQDIKEVK